MKIIADINEWNLIRQKMRAGKGERVAGDGIGFVPTMGALHEGHLSLLKRSRAENSISALSIYVNSTQFDRDEDLKNYPRQLEQDFEMAQAAGVDYVITPDFAQMYADGYTYQVHEKHLSQKLCGACRPGHFDGVLTVVLKLLNLVAPTRAYFGEKDYQQLKLIRGMVQAFFLPVEIVACPTIREPDGLAKSSRNQRLLPQEREIAPFLYRTLSDASLNPNAVKEALTRRGFKVDYVEEIDGRRFGAAYLGRVRLIDNVVVG